MARKTQELESKETDRRSETERPPAPLDPIAGAIDSLSRQFIGVVKDLQTQEQTDNRHRQNYEAHELKWTKRAAKAGIGFSILSVILSALTLVVLDRTLSVYRGQKTIMATQADISKTQAGIAQDQLKFANSADLSLMPMRVNPPCQLQWLITNDGNAKAEHLEIFNGVKNLPQMSKIQFGLLDSSEAMVEIKEQSADWAGLLKSHHIEMETMRADGATQDQIDKSDKKWRASLPEWLPRRITMELPRNVQIPYAANVCASGVTDATTAPFVNVLLYSYEDTFGTHTGETCVGYFPGVVEAAGGPGGDGHHATARHVDTGDHGWRHLIDEHLAPCTEPVPTQ